MTTALEAATFAWRLTVEGAQAVTGAFEGIGKAAGTSMGGIASAGAPANAALLALTEHLSGTAKQLDGLEKLRRELTIIAGVGGLGLVVESSLNAAVNVKKMAAEAGMATTPFQELVYALRQFHVEGETARVALTKFSEETAQFVTHNAGPAKQAYETLFGANAQKIAQQGLTNVDQFFQQVLERIGKMKNEAQKLELLKEIFGRNAGPELIEAADAGQAAIQREREEAERLGIVFSDDLIDKASDAKLRMEDLSAILHAKLAVAIDENADKIAHFVELGIDMIPVLTTAFQALFNVVANLRDAYAAISVSLLDIYQVGKNLGGQYSAMAHNVLHPSSQHAVPGLGDDLVNPLNAFDGNPGFGTAPGAGGLHITVHAKDQSSGVVPLGDDETTNKLKAEKEAYDKLTFSLQQQIAAMGTSDREMFISNEERKLGAQATDAQRAAIGLLAGQLYDEKEAWTELKGAAHSTGDAFSKFFEQATLGTKNFSSALHSLEQQLLSIAYKFLIGDPMTKAVSGFLENGFGKGTGTGTPSLPGGNFMSAIGNFFGGGKAGGGPLDTGKWYIAGEHGPEPIWGGGPGAFAAGYPGAQKSAPGNVFQVDMRGASVEAVARLEELVNKVNGSIETRALYAVQQARVRSVNYGG